jgi:2-C-methyl-D-erythritol 4-phosphate cytidylyltransferase
MNSQKVAIIVAGGSGSRMGSSLPKQFIEIGGMPILMHTLRLFRDFDPQMHLILVLPETQVDFWEKLCIQFDDFSRKFPHHIVLGGTTRFQSCQNGIQALPARAELVAIHDGVRPFVAQETLKKGFQMAAAKGSAVVAVSPKDSIRMLGEKDENHALNRSQIRLVQTPQIFQKEWLVQAYAQPESHLFTDDASVVEAAGFSISLVEGTYENIKITTPEDLLWANTFLKTLV